MDKMETHELISALADGQLQGEEFAHGVGAASADRDALDTWHRFHLIGEVLRTGECSMATRPEAFVTRLRSRLTEEAAHGVPLMPAVAPSTVIVAGARAQPAAAANDGSFRWKLVAGFASAAAVAAIGWPLVEATPKTQEPQVAAVPPAGPVVAMTNRGPMIRDARLDQLLAAHRQLGGASALPTPAGFLRNATFEASPR